jgi:hypothetical protein
MYSAIAIVLQTEKMQLALLFRNERTFSRTGRTAENAEDTEK